MTDWLLLLFAFAAGGGAILGLCWRRLALVEHLESELRDLHDAGFEVSIGRNKDFSAFNFRLEAAKELLDRIESRR